MADEKKVHVRISMETFGEEYQKIELLDCCCILDFVKRLQEKLVGVLLSQNK